MSKVQYITADSGEHQEFSTGAKRDARSGKGRFDLLSPVALHRMAGVYERGSSKYGDRNWEKGMPLSRFLDSFKRHINDYELICLYKREGISLDKLPPDVNPNEDHLAQAIWNGMCMLHMEAVKPELDDLSHKAPEPPVAKKKIARRRRA